MRKKILAVGAVALTLGCGGGTDFWGNPLPESSDDGSTCAVPPTPVPAPPPFDPGALQRPGDVVPGNSWIVFELEVRALGQDTANDYCVPIAVHVYARSGEADTVTFDDKGVPAGPHDIITTTPWFGHYVALQYDPTEERFAGNPPTYEVHLDARYEEDRDMTGQKPPAALRCAIKLRGATVASDLVIVGKGSNVRCELRGNDHWIHS